MEALIWVAVAMEVAAGLLLLLYCYREYRMVVRQVERDRVSGAWATMMHERIWDETDDGHQYP